MKAPRRRSASMKAAASIRDFDELVRLLSGWDGSFSQLSRGRFEGSMAFARGPRVQVHSATGNQEIQVRGKERADVCMLTLVLPESEGCLWQHRRATAGSIIVRDASVQVDHRACRGAENLSMAIGEETLRSAAWSLGYDLGRLGWKLIHPDPVQFRSLERRLRSFLALGPDSPERRQAECACIAAAAEALSPPYSQGHYDPPVSVRAPLLRKAEERMRDATDGGLDESALCGELGVSSRTLRLAFREHYGFGPIDYYLTLRLNEARHALKKADPRCVSVASVAGAYGFAHPGKFAGYYRRLFGELPSHSLPVRNGAAVDA